MEKQNNMRLINISIILLTLLSVKQPPHANNSLTILQPFNLYKKNETLNVTSTNFNIGTVRKFMCP